MGDDNVVIIVEDEGNIEVLKNKSGLLLPEITEGVRKEKIDELITKLYSLVRHV